MRFGKVQKTLTFALALASASPVLLAHKLVVGWTIGFLVLMAIGWFLEPPLTQNTSFRKTIAGLVLFALLIQVARIFFGSPFLITGMEFVLLLLGLKLCSRVGAADYQQIVILAFLQLIVATGVVEDLTFASGFLFFVLLSPPVLTLAHLRKEMEDRTQATTGLTNAKKLQQALSSRRIVSYRFLFGSLFLSVPVLVITAILFVLFPRMRIGFLGNVPRNESVAGFSEEVTLGDVDLIRQEDTEVIKLFPLGKHGYHPNRLAIRLRGAILDVYQDGRWSRTDEGQWFTLHRRRTYRLDRNPPTQDTQGFEIFQEPLTPAVVFLPEGTGLMRIEALPGKGKKHKGTLEMNRQGALRYKDDAKVGIQYKAYLTGAPPYGRAPNQQIPYLNFPDKHAKLAKLASDLAGQGTAQDKAFALVTSLKSRYSYSTSLASSQANALARTPLDRFLYTRKTGTCEHFATALTLMLRAVGIPARLVTGFMGAEWNPYGEFYTVRKRSAHAWTEAFFNDKWVTLDATPAAREEIGTWRMNAFRLMFEALRMRWQKHIVFYDTKAQLELAKQLSDFWKTRSQGQSKTKIPFPTRFILGFLVIAGLIFLLMRHRTRTANRSTRAIRKSPEHKLASQLYRRLDQRLARLGWERAPQQTPLEYLATLKQHASPYSQTAETITQWYLQTRFGGHPNHPQEVKRMKKSIRQLTRKTTAKPHPGLRAP